MQVRTQQLKFQIYDLGFEWQNLNSTKIER